MNTERRNKILVNIQDLKQQYYKKIQLLEDTMKLLSSFNKQPSQPKKIYKKPSIKKNTKIKKKIERKKVHIISSTYKHTNITLEDSIRKFIQNIQKIPKKEIEPWFPDIDQDIQYILEKLENFQGWK